MKVAVLVSAFLLPVVALTHDPSPLLADDGRDLSFLLKRHNRAVPILRRAVKGKNYIVPRTLQVEKVPVRRAPNGLVERQQQCLDPGYALCPGGAQCCPAGSSCGPGTCCPAGNLACTTVCCPDATGDCCQGNICCPAGQACFRATNGSIGCCPRGNTCTTIAGCADPTLVECPGDSFCCRPGATCARDSAGNAVCRDPTVNTPPPPPPTTDYVQSTVLNTDTITTTITTTKPTGTSTHVDNTRPNANTVTATATADPDPIPIPIPNPSDTGNSNSNNNNNNVALVGGVVGGCLGAAVLSLVGVLLWRRTRGAPASQPITPATSASLAFSTDSNYMGGPPVTYAAQPGWHPQQSSLLSLPPGAGAGAAGQSSTSSQQSASPPPAVRMWVEGASTLHQGAQGRPASQSLSLSSSPTEGPVDPRELYRDAIRGSRSPVAAPMNVPSSAPGPLPHAPAYSFVPEKSDVKQKY